MNAKKAKANELLVNQTLADATASYRDDYRARYEQFYIDELHAIRAELAAAGWDSHKVADYPSSNMSRVEYRAKVEKYHYVQKHFESVGYSGRPSEPCIVKERPFTTTKIKAQAKADADAAFNGYLIKLAQKIAKEIESAIYAGHLWEGSTLSVVCKDGERQTWDTKCILNRSCLGTLFNQFPTRRRQF